MPKIKMIGSKKSEAAKKYWIVTYTNPNEHYEEETYEVPADQAKTPGEAFWQAMFDIDALCDEKEMMAVYGDEGFDNIDELRASVVAFVDDPNSDLAKRCPENIVDRDCLSAKLVTSSK